MVMTICLTGCSSVRAMTVKNEDGSIDELIYVSIDSEILLSKEYDIDAVKEDISNTGYSEARQVMIDFQNKITSYIETNYSSLTQETKAILFSYSNGLSVVGNRWQDELYVVGIRFADINVYKYYYGITGNEEENKVEEEHFLYNRIYYFSDSLYTGYDGIIGRLNSIYQAKFSDFIESDNEFLYTHVSEYGRKHSNADYITKSGGKYYHTWVIDMANAEQDIYFYYNIANRGNCIIACIIASVVILAIMLIVGFVIIKIKNVKLKSKHKSGNQK